MNRESVELGLVLKQIPNYEFSMVQFNDRLRLQKIVYLMQTFGIDLGYQFSFYRRGPYCSTLARNGFALAGRYDKMEECPEFRDRHKQGLFEDFKKFISDKTDPMQLEALASIHCLKADNSDGGDRAKITHRVVQKLCKNYPEPHDKIPAMVEGMWGLLEDGNLLNPTPRSNASNTAEINPLDRVFSDALRLAGEGESQGEDVDPTPRFSGQRHDRLDVEDYRILQHMHAK